MPSGGTTKEFSIVIPELEEIAKAIEGTSFSEEEDKIILAYWGRVPRQTITNVLNEKYDKSHTMEQVRHRHRRLTEQLSLS